jgi:autotransporter translocation and assembly factor TamB
VTTDPTAETAAPRGSRPRTRRLLLALLLAVLALGVLLPASPPALGWVWTQLQHAAEQQGFTLNARAVHGNLLSGLTLKDARLQHDSLDITLASLELD